MSALKVFCLKRCFFVGILCILDNLLAALSGSDFAQVSVVVTAHFHVEYLSVNGSGMRNKDLLHKVKHVHANVLKLLLNLLSIVLNEVKIFATLILFFVLNGRDCPPGSSSLSSIVLVGNTKQVPFFT